MARFHLQKPLGLSWCKSINLGNLSCFDSWVFKFHCKQVLLRALRFNKLYICFAKNNPTFNNINKCIQEMHLFFVKEIITF